MDNHSCYHFLLCGQNCSIRSLLGTKIASVSGQMSCNNKHFWSFTWGAPGGWLSWWSLPTPRPLTGRPCGKTFSGMNFDLALPVSLKVGEVLVIWIMDFFLGWGELNAKSFVNLRIIKGGLGMFSMLLPPWWSLCCRGNIGEASGWLTSGWEECCQRSPHTSPKYSSYLIILMLLL